MACCRQACLTVCLMCAYHIPTYSFYARISAGSTVSGLTNGFSNPLVCWKFFQPPVLKPKPKMYLNTSIPFDSCLSHPPAVTVCFDGLKHFRGREKEMQAGKAKDIRKAQIMRCQAGQTIIVNYIYSSAVGMQP